MTISIIGLGLIGGSLALTLKKQGFCKRIIGVENNPWHLQEAEKLGMADNYMPLHQAVNAADLIILAVPVNVCAVLLPTILDVVENQVVMDVGSTKSTIVETIATHPKRSRFVPTHPMWGTEYSGPSAAMDHAFKNKATVICRSNAIDEDALQLVESLYNCLEMRLLYMDARQHDIHIAYVSHISHITSFALANTVLEKEKEEDNIFNLASSGFDSTVRLAKSSPVMWLPIFEQNKENVLDVLNEHISQLRKFKACLEKENWTYLRELMEGSNNIKKIIDR